MLMKILIILLFSFISVGFYSLIEQKILGYMNNRIGPNKILFIGLIQFISDFIKLVFKDNIYLLLFNYLSYYFFIYMFFVISLMYWIMLPFFLNLFNLKFMILFMIMLMINKIILFIIIIWSLNSVYSIISLIRLIIQNLSFEILFMLIMFMYIFMYKNFNLIYYNNYNLSSFIFFSYLVFYVWMLVMLVELNRIPFDFLESESELISGVNLEFSSINFLLLFLIEYLDMIFFMIISLIVFMNLNIMKMYSYIILMLFMLLLLLFRGFFVRYRIDKLLYLLWKFFFPMLMNLFVFLIYLKF
uniref:NADH-ubiquinone oxidoreductase chain 1 n=1 Tax=Ferrisia gilli TaxID=223229 RepID=Q5DKY1_9HEMI|nr:NADH dehydrogenase subunit 1 [Ferrisia gilli]